jgi:hypothetical protein
VSLAVRAKGVIGRIQWATRAGSWNIETLSAKGRMKRIRDSVGKMLLKEGMRDANRQYDGCSCTVADLKNILMRRDRSLSPSRQ